MIALTQLEHLQALYEQHATLVQCLHEAGVLPVQALLEKATERAVTAETQHLPARLPLPVAIAVQSLYRAMSDGLPPFVQR